MRKAFRSLDRSFAQARQRRSLHSRKKGALKRERARSQTSESSDKVVCIVQRGASARARIFACCCCCCLLLAAACCCYCCCCLLPSPSLPSPPLLGVVAASMRALRALRCCCSRVPVGLRARAHVSNCAAAIVCLTLTLTLTDARARAHIEIESARHRLSSLVSAPRSTPSAR